MKLFSLLAALLLCPFAGAGDFAETVTPIPLMGNWQINDPVGAWPFVGAGFGFVDHNDSVRTGGAPLSIKMLGSYYFENRKIVGDLSLSTNTHFLTQNGRGADTIVSTDLGVAARYRFQDGWQAGPAINTLIGTDRYNSVNGKYTSFIGVQALKEMTYSNQYLVRIGGRLATDTDIKGENVNLAMVEMAVGFLPKRTGLNLTQSERKPQPVRGRNIPIAMEPTRIQLGGFALSSSELNTEMKSRLQRLAKTLKSEPGLVERIQIVGHADPSGTEKINDRLGFQRAEEVAQALTQAGVDPSLIQTVTFGANQPLENSKHPEALAKSRRVEVRFIGVTDQEKLTKILNR